MPSARFALLPDASVDERADAGRRQVLRAIGALALAPVAGVAMTARGAALPADVRFRALRKGTPIGVHTVTFREDRERFIVVTRIDIAVKVLMLTAFYLKHDAQEVWQGGRLIALKSTTDDNGTRLQVSGTATDAGFRIVGEEGPFLAPAKLLTSNTLWDPRMLREERLIDVQYGGVIGLAVKQLASTFVDTPAGRVLATCHHVITPHYAGTLFHDSSGRWVKGLVEAKGEIIEYVLQA